MSLFYYEDSDDEVANEQKIVLNSYSNEENAKDNNDQETVSLSQQQQAEQLKQNKDNDLYPLLPKDEEINEDDLVDHIDPVNVTLSLSLKFQQLILQDLISDNALLIMGKGLGLEPITANLLHVLSAPATTISKVEKKSLVIVLGATDEDNEKINEQLIELSWLDNTQRAFNIIKSDKQDMNKRKSLYQQGGIMSVTSRIFIVDLFAGTVNPQKITGIVILHPEKFNDLSNESFITFIYRQHNKWGFIKALSDSVEDFSSDFNPLEKKLKHLKLSKALLWPRFHIEVTSSLLTKDTKNVTEIKIAMSPAMKQIQIGLWANLKKCIDEVRRENSELAPDYWSIENALDSKFINTFHIIFAPYWHMITFKTKQLIKDIKVLKDLLHFLIYYDCVDFREMMELVTDGNKAKIDKQYPISSLWLDTDEAAAVLNYSQKRVIDESGLVLEENPKWEQLAILLDDISNERAHDSKKSGPVLIMCTDHKVKVQLQNYLSMMKQSKVSRAFSARSLLLKKYQRFRESKTIRNNITKEFKESSSKENEKEKIYLSKAFNRQPVSSKRRRTRGGSAVAAVGRMWSKPSNEGEDLESQITREDLEMELMEVDLNNDEMILSDNDEEMVEIENSILLERDIIIDNYEFIEKENQIIIESYNSDTDDSVLQELSPSFIIMYDADLSFIRRVEIFQAINVDNPSKVYFMYYGDSIEEQRHLLSIRKEKDSFTRLIREKSTMASRYDDEDVSQFKLKKSQVMNTRIAGGSTFQNSSQESIVLVDTREFGAPLPGLLHKIGMRVIPLQLTVGDYILTERVCLERKSIPDLIGSFNSGRLYEQCERMSKYYELPALLIEFDKEESFSLEPFSENRRKKNKMKQVNESIANRDQEDIQQKLALLVLRFPRLRILWSSSPYRTAELILELKAGREEPNILKATAAGSNTSKNDESVDPNNTNELYNLKVLDLIKDVPGGMSQVDMYSIMRKVKTSKELLNLEKSSLIKIVGDEDLADRLYKYLVENYK
ncbi:hypothetical protein WICMUC_003995 [Wickerhamomyces mucosus]|uniref:ERCC4 domain-containing protein n=1 Tax=Wickerhamomyces mucosus TaxID=1378264 RepID=A0A9P8PIL0_9ASCO|nr:hypothetical protein WICMUC_003995 [Wickerhamomyces mucosus]